MSTLGFHSVMRRMGASGLIAAALIGCALTTAGTADALTVSSYEITDPMGTDDVVRVASTRAGLKVTSGGAPLTVGEGCRAVGAREARCDVGYNLDIDLGEGDDRATVQACGSCTTVADGGSGRDVLRAVSGDVSLKGGSGNDRLIGGRDRDILTGGTGSDRLSGGRGDDILDGDGTRTAGNDTLDGGPGRDFAKWGDSRPVRASLARGRGGRGGERDRLTRVESLMGSRRADRLTGDGASNTLFGGPGPDTLRGGAGRDRIDPDRPRILYSVTGRDGSRDRIGCGPGADRVSDARADVLGSDCERMSSSNRNLLAGGAIRVQPLGGRRSGRVRFEVACEGSVLRCRRKVSVSANGRRIGTSRLVTTRSTINGGAFVPVRLTQPIRPGQVVRVVVTGTNRETDLGGDRDQATFGYRFAYRYRSG